MTRRPCSPRLLVASLLACVPFLVAACGGDAQPPRIEYEATVRTTLAEIDAPVSRLVADLRGVTSGRVSAADVAVEAAELRPRVDGAAEDLDAVTPPADARDLHDELVGAFRAFSGELAAFEAAVAERDVDRVRSFVGTGFASLARLDRVVERFETAGYDVDDADAR